MDAQTVFLTLIILAIGGCLAWWARGYIEDQTTEWEIESDDDESGEGG